MVANSRCYLPMIKDSCHKVERRSFAKTLCVGYSRYDDMIWVRYSDRVGER